MEPRLIKRLLIIGVIAALSLVFWWSSATWINSQISFTSYALWLKPLIALCFLATMTVLAFMVLADLRWMFAASLVTSLAFMLVFGWTPINLIAVGLLFFFHYYGMRTVRQELTERIRINTEVIMERGLWWVVVPLMIMVSFGYYNSPSVQASARTQQLPASVQTTIAAVTNAFASQQNLAPADQKDFQKALFKEVINRLTGYARPYFSYFPPILAFGLFLVLQGLSFIFIYISLWLGILSFFLMKRTGIISIEEKQVKAEVLIF